ncbi:hypothetical protein [Saccharopolyspora tripterygii]
MRASCSWTPPEPCYAACVEAMRAAHGKILAKGLQDHHALAGPVSVAAWRNRAEDPENPQSAGALIGSWGGGMRSAREIGAVGTFGGPPPLSR